MVDDLYSEVLVNSRRLCAVDHDQDESMLWKGLNHYVYVQWIVGNVLDLGAEPETGY